MFCDMPAKIGFMAKYQRRKAKIRGESAPDRSAAYAVRPGRSAGGGVRRAGSGRPTARRSCFGMGGDEGGRRLRSCPCGSRGAGPGGSAARFGAKGPVRRCPACGSPCANRGRGGGRRAAQKHWPAASGRRRYEKSPAPADGSRTRRVSPKRSDYFTFGPAATRFLPSSLPVNFVKFFTKRLARSSAFVSHSLASL